MADFSASKQDFCNQMIALERTVLTAIEDMEALTAALAAHGFNSGGPNQFVDGDFSVNNKHLTAAIVNDVMFAFANIAPSISTGQRDALRKGIPGGLP
jgi:hypothetical protein